MPRRIVPKGHQYLADSITTKLQTSCGMNSTKTVRQELHGMSFHGGAALVGVMCKWPSIFVHIGYACKSLLTRCLMVTVG